MLFRWRMRVQIDDIFKISVTIRHHEFHHRLNPRGGGIMKELIFENLARYKYFVKFSW